MEDELMLHFVFDGPPGPECGRFVECETPDGRSVNAGEWHERPDGFWELRVAALTSPESDHIANAGKMIPDGEVADMVERAFREGFQYGNFAGGGNAASHAEGQAWQNSTAMSRLSDAVEKTK